MDDHQQYQESLALHALDALDAAEARSLEAHLASCAECRAALIEWRDATGLLAYASTPAAPSDELRGRILAAARTETRTPQTEASAKVVPLPIAPRRSNLWPNLLKIAAAIAIVGLLIGMIVFWRRDVRMQRDIARLTHERNRTADQLAREREARAKEISAAVTKGKSLASAAAESGFTVTTTPAVTRKGSSQSNPPASVVAKMFELKPGENTVSGGADGWYVVQLKTIEIPDPATDAAAVGQVANQLTDGIRGDILAQFEKALRNRFPVTIRQQEIDRLL